MNRSTGRHGLSGAQSELSSMMPSSHRGNGKSLADMKAERLTNDLEEKLLKERRRSTLVLILAHLVDHGYMEAAKALQSECRLPSGAWVVADNGRCARRGAAGRACARPARLRYPAGARGAGVARGVRVSAAASGCQRGGAGGGGGA